MDNIKISVVTVCFNSVKTIEQTIKSVINQTYRNIEYIIFDGGSSDGTLDIIRKYEEHIAYWVSEPDKGIYDAMNKGIAKATGDIIGIINSDDWYANDAIEIVENYFMEHPETEMVHGDMMIVYEDGFQRLTKGTPKESILTLYSHPTIFIKKSIYDRHGMFDLQYSISADLDLILRFKYAGVNIFYIPRLLTYFRWGGESTTRLWATFKEQKNIIHKNIIGQHFTIRQIEEAMNIIRRFEISPVSQYIRRRMVRSNCLRECLSTSLANHGKKSFAIWGAGDEGEVMIRFFQPNERMIQYIVDSDKHKHGKQIYGISVISPKNISDDSIVIVTSYNYQKQICRELERKGFIRFRDYITNDEFYLELLRWYIMYIKVLN